MHTSAEPRTSNASRPGLEREKQAAAYFTDSTAKAHISPFQAAPISCESVDFPLGNIQRAEELLESFATALKHYANPTFDFAQFRSQTTQLHGKFFEVLHFVRPLVQFKRSLWGHLRFVHYFFDIMEVSAEYMDRFSGSSSAQALVRRVANLNVAILALHNSKCEPAIDEEDYSMEVARFTYKLQVTEEYFSTLMEMPADVRSVFECQYAVAKYTLRVLQGHISREDPVVLP